MAETKKKEEGGMNGGTRHGGSGNHLDEEEGTEMTEIGVRRKTSTGDFDVDVVVNVVTEKSKTTTIKEEVEEEEAATQV